jgi:hypothetical protein
MMVIRISGMKVPNWFTFTNPILRRPVRQSPASRTMRQRRETPLALAGQGTAWIQMLSLSSSGIVVDNWENPTASTTIDWIFQGLKPGAMPNSAGRTDLSDRQQ